MKYSDVLREANQIRRTGASRDVKKIKVAMLSSFTLDFIRPFFEVAADRAQFFPDFFWGGYNQYAQEIIAADSKLYEFAPDLLVLAVRLEEVYPALVNDYLRVLPDSSKALEQIVTLMERLIKLLRTRLACSVLIHNFLTPVHNCCGLSDFQHPDGAANLVRRLNLALVEMVNRYSGVYVVDFENLAGRLGKRQIMDSKMWYLAKNPYKTVLYQSLATEYLKYLKSIYGLQKKCIVLDLDNTLWGGLAGEDGIFGIQLGDGYPGNCYQDFQRELLKLNQRGVLLAVNSKNNGDEALEIITRHPGMVLKEANFACLKINWDNKAGNLAAIAAELNIGLDSMVFIDDSQAECELVRQKLPEVTTLQLPDTPFTYVDLLNDLGLFETIAITAESLRKTEMYQAQVERQRLADSVGSLTEYYRSLEMVVVIQAANEILLPRVAELTQKTNQFNLTTRRYTREDLGRMIGGGAYLLYTLRVTDKFGDNGVVGVCIIHKISREEWYIDTFLLSCRVLNRTIENALMAFIYERAKANHVRRLIGEYFPTPKNRPVEHFYEQIGFIKQDGRYLFEVDRGAIRCPEYFIMKPDECFVKKPFGSRQRADTSVRP
jgi:FkbH-like protein